jgi:hypothetical protein
VQGDKLNVQCKAVLLKEEETKLLFQKLNQFLLEQVVTFLLPRTVLVILEIQ